jgi:DNA-directed RNA polymerase I, II, and III subunit RPABC2
MSGEDEIDDIDDGQDALDLLVEDDIAADDLGIEGAQKVARESRALQFLVTNHPECKLDSIENILEKLPLKSYIPGEDDSNHRSVPYVTQFEQTKIIGFRSNQLSNGAKPFVQVPKHITDIVDIARLEFEQRRLPYIIKRPMPDGTYEYWRLSDLMIL